MLNISKQIMTVWDHGAGPHALPEVEIIPMGNAANEKKKLDKAVSTFNSSHEYDNIPMPGFTVFDSSRKNWGSPDRTWLIIDPRGFLARVTSDNLELIFKVTGITEGLIQEKCVWAREDSQTKMVLVPVSSPSYLEAVKNTELLEHKVTLKDVKIGDTVLLQNGMQGKYLGTMTLYGPGSSSTWVSYDDFVMTSVPRKQIVEVGPGQFFYGTNARILKVVSPAAEPMTKQSGVQYVRDAIAAGKALFSMNKTFTPVQKGYGIVDFVSTHAVTPLLTLQEISRDDACARFHYAHHRYDYTQLVLEDKDGRKFLLDFGHNSLSQTGADPKFNTLAVKTVFTEPVTKIDLFESRPWHDASRPGTETLDNFVKFYKILKHVKDETYI